MGRGLGDGDGVGAIVALGVALAATADGDGLSGDVAVPQAQSRLASTTARRRIRLTASSPF